MNLILVLLWIYGIWSGWKQMSTGSGFIGGLLPSNSIQWLNKKVPQAIAVKAGISIILGGIFAVFGLLYLLLKLMHNISKM